MKRLDVRSVVSVVLLVVVMAYAGCSADPATAPSTTPTGPAGKSASATSSGGNPASGSASPIEKLLAELNNPAAVLIVSGEQDGYLEPCGCTDGQIGGLLRRYDFFERLRKQNWPVTSLIDLGSLIKDPAVARGGFEQAKFKFDYSIKALKLLDYSALALSAEDMKVGVGEALGLFLNNLGEKTKIVVANVAAPAGYESMFRPSLVVPAGPVKVGVTAVIDPEALEKLNDPDKDACSPRSSSGPSDVLPGVLAELEPKSDYQVLMVQGPPALAKRLAEAYPGFDIVVATSEYARPAQATIPRCSTAARPCWSRSARRGSTSGSSASIPASRSGCATHLVTLNTRYDGPATPMKKLIEDDYRDISARCGVVENYPAARLRQQRLGRDLRRRRQLQVVPPQHLHEMVQRPSTPRRSTRSWRDPKPNSIYDAECVTCHTTGFEYNSGWKSRTEDALPEGQPVRELPRPRLEARRRARQPRVSQGDGPDRRAGREEPPLPTAATTRTTRAFRVRQVLRPDRPQGPRHIQRPQGPQGNRAGPETRQAGADQLLEMSGRAPEGNRGGKGEVGI